MEITGISKSIDVERLTSERSTLLGIGTRQYVKVIFYVDLNENRRKVKVKGVYVDVINIYGDTRGDAHPQLLIISLTLKHVTGCYNAHRFSPTL